MTTQKEIRAAFWDRHPQYKRAPGKSQNDYSTGIRVSFCDFVDMLFRDGEISEALASRATL